MDRRIRTVSSVSAVALLAVVAAGPAAAAAGTEPDRGAVVPAPALPTVPAVGPVGAPAGSNQQSGARAQASGTPMRGQFVVSAGKCGSGATPVGSYFSMLDPSGKPVDNGDSPCGNKSATPVGAGNDGLLPGRMQPFAASPGQSRAIIAPTTFFGSPFAVATQAPDKQSGASVEAPSILESGGKLSGQISAFQAFYNGAYYNQGAPKPGGGTPGRTSAGVTGTYDRSSGAFVLAWRSTITGGAFNSFTGVWHLEGVYKGGAAASSGGSSSGGSSSGSSSSSGSQSTGSATTGTASGAGGAGPQGGAGPLLADTGPGPAVTGTAALGLCATTLALWWRRRAGWSS